MSRRTRSSSRRAEPRRRRERRKRSRRRGRRRGSSCPERGTSGFFGWIAYTLLRAERRDRPDTEYRLFDSDETRVLTAMLAYALGARLRHRNALSLLLRLPAHARSTCVPRRAPQPVRATPRHAQLRAASGFLPARCARFQALVLWIERAPSVSGRAERHPSVELRRGARIRKRYSERRCIAGLPILPVVCASWSF
jgi:hypothetical protein